MTPELQEDLLDFCEEVISKYVESYKRNWKPGARQVLEPMIAAHFLQDGIVVSSPMPDDMMRIYFRPEFREAMVRAFGGMLRGELPDLGAPVLITTLSEANTLKSKPLKDGRKLTPEQMKEEYREERARYPDLGDHPDSVTCLIIAAYTLNAGTWLASQIVDDKTGSVHEKLEWMSGPRGKDFKTIEGRLLPPEEQLTS